MGQVLTEQERSARVDRMRSLAALRASDSWQYKNIAEFHGGAHECEFVSPYSKSAHNVEADIFVMLQDWASEDGLSGPVNADTVRLGYTPNVATDINLIRLLRDHLGLTLAEVYATNLFPFIKPGGMSSLIPRKDLVRAAQVFGWPQIEIIRPRLVIALGLDTFNALCEAKGVGRAAGRDAAIAHPADVAGIRVWCQSHPGGLGQAGRGGKEAVNADWRTMAEWYRSHAR